jgi:hypothetical protein
MCVGSMVYEEGSGAESLVSHSLSELYQTPEFFCYCFKVLPCSKVRGRGFSWWWAVARPGGVMG